MLLGSWELGVNNAKPLFLLFRPSSTQNVGEAAVALVTCVLIGRVLCVTLEWHRIRPRLLPGIGVVEPDFPADRVGIDRREPLGHLELFAGSAECDQRMEVRRLDNQRVALPATTRVAHVV